MASTWRRATIDPVSNERDSTPLHAMSDDERRRLLRRRSTPRDGPGIDIGGDTPARRLLRTGGRLLTFGAIAAVFVLASYRFTASWRVAAIVVGLMGGYMWLIGRLVQGRADRPD